MKRHISVFAFLLGAFAAGFVPLTARAYYVYSWGYQLPDGRSILEAGGINLDTDQPLVILNQKVNLSANFPKMENQGKGLSVDYWLEQMTFPGSSFAGTKIQGSDGKNPYAWTCTASSGNSYFAVKCKYITYNLKYDANGGSSVHSYPDTYDLEAAPIREGYTFGGWKDGGGVTHAEKETVSGASFAELDDVHTNGATVTLMAMWAVRDYNVRSEGSNCKVEVAPSAAYDGDLTISWTPDGPWVKPTVTVYAGTDDKGTPIKTYSNLSEDTTFVKFNMSDLDAYYDKVFVKVSYEIYTITYNGNGGFFSDPTETSVTRRIENNTPIREFPEVHWDGDRMSLKGWYRAAGSEIEVNIGDRYEWGMDMTFYAKWVPSDTFNISGEVLPLAAGWIEGTNTYVKGRQVTLTANPSNGYSFVEWQRGDARITDSTNLEVTVEGDAHYTAFFTGNVYTVKFDCEDELAERAQVTCPKAIKLTYGDPFGDLPVPTVGNPDYRFVCWMFEDDTEITPDTSFTMSGKNNYIYAKVVLLPTYVIHYDGNRSTSGSMSNQKMYCGVPANLTSNTYERGGYDFRGWATNEADAAALKIAYEDGELVTDIAPTNGTVTLYAVWESISLAEAMHCDNLEWTNTVLKGTSNPSEWTVDYGAGRGSNTMSCVTQQGDWLTSCVLTSFPLTANGTLSFHWRSEEEGGKMLFWLSDTQVEKNYPGSATPLAGTAGRWSAFSTDVVASEEKPIYVHIISDSDSASVSIDLMTWTPSGSEPKYVDVDSPVTGFSMADGKLVFAFDATNDGTSAYHLLGTNDLVAPMPWPMVFKIGKPSGSSSFEIPIKEDEPKMFYRIRALK